MQISVGYHYPEPKMDRCLHLGNTKMEHGVELQHLVYVHSAFFRYHCAFFYE